MNRDMCMYYQKTILLFILGTLCIANTFAQDVIPTAEMQLKALHSRISYKNSDKENLRLNDSIYEVLERTLKFPGSFIYPFDSLKYLGKITSSDNRVRAITWNLELKNGSFLYFGFIMRKTAGNQIDIYSLSDQSNDIVQPEIATLKPEKWYGCLIYEIIEEKIEGETHYFYLGYHPENIFINQKLIDVMWFQNNDLLFGKPVFSYNKTMNHRVIFRYSAKARMMLTWNGNHNMIVFDHLVPTEPSQTGKFQFYVPDLSFDGFKFEKGFWIIQENLDVRN